MWLCALVRAQPIDLRLSGIFYVSFLAILLVVNRLMLVLSRIGTGGLLLTAMVSKRTPDIDGRSSSIRLAADRSEA